MTDNQEQLARIIPLVVPELEFMRPQGVRSADLPMPDYENFAEVSEILAQVHDEMERQDNRWGQQDHPLLRTGTAFGIGIDFVLEVRAYFQEAMEAEKASNDILARAGDCDWRGILLEEVYEALSEDDADLAIVELVQVAAVAVQAALSIKRNGLGDEGILPVKDAA